MIRSATVLLALATSVSFAFAATDDELRQEIIGAWGQDAVCSTGSLTFRDDGTFAFAQPGVDAVGGTWSITEGVLKGTRDGGGEQPDATISFADGKMSMTETGDSQRTAVFERCPA
jgi:hypothetical protein